MKYVALDKKYSVKSAVHGEVETPENFFEIPELELQGTSEDSADIQLKEVLDFVGGPQGILDAVNDVVRSDAKGGGLAIIRNGGKDSVLTELMDRAKSFAKAFTWSSERGTSKKKLLEGVDKIRAMKDDLKSLSQEDLYALIAGTLLK